MEKFGLLIANVILKSSVVDVKTAISDIDSIGWKKEGIFENPFNYNKRIVLSNMKDIKTSNDQIHSVEYRLEKNSLMIYLHGEYMHIKLSLYSVSSKNLVFEVIRRYIEISELTLIGFELSLFIDEYPKNIHSIVRDKSMYPLYLRNQIKNEDVIKFERYSLKNSTKEMELTIEQLVQDIFKSSKVNVHFTDKY